MRDEVIVSRSMPAEQICSCLSNLSKPLQASVYEPLPPPRSSPPPVITPGAKWRLNHPPVKWRISRPRYHCAFLCVVCSRDSALKLAPASFIERTNHACVLTTDAVMVGFAECTTPQAGGACEIWRHYVNGT